MGPDWRYRAIRDDNFYFAIASSTRRSGTSRIAANKTADRLMRRPAED
jgi:hypothetical protein